MCKAFLVRHTCNHVSPPRLETCPTKIRFGTCKKVARIEVKGAKLCSRCTVGLSSDQHQQPTPSTSTRIPVVEPQSTVSKKVKRAKDWMNAVNKPSQNANPVEVKTQTSPNRNAPAQSAKAMTIKTDEEMLIEAEERKAKQAEARTRNAGKKRNFQIAPDESSDKSSIKKQQSNPKPKATHNSDFLSVKAQSKPALPSSALTPTPRPVVRKSRKKAAPKRLDLQNSGTPLELRKATQHNSNPNASPNSDITPKSKTINSLSKLNEALQSKLRSLGYSPTPLHSALFSPAESARLARFMYVDPRATRRSPRLTPEARAEMFLNQLGRHIVGSGEKEGTARTLVSPRGAYDIEETLDPDELDEFERAMMQSESSPGLESGKPPDNALGSVGRDGLFESSESEEE